VRGSSLGERHHAFGAALLVFDHLGPVVEKVLGGLPYFLPNNGVLAGDKNQKKLTVGW
jgi:hypothetical protein